jgi:hypothetical protein
VDPQTPYTNVILHIVYLGSSILWWYPFPRPKRRQEESEMENKDQVSIPSRHWWYSCLPEARYSLFGNQTACSLSGLLCCGRAHWRKCDGESALDTAFELDLQELLQNMVSLVAWSLMRRPMVRKTKKNNFAITVLRNRETPFCVHLEINHRYRRF